MPLNMQMLFLKRKLVFDIHNILWYLLNHFIFIFSLLEHLVLTELHKHDEGGADLVGSYFIGIPSSFGGFVRFVG